MRYTDRLLRRSRTAAGSGGRSDFAWVPENMVADDIGSVVPRELDLGDSRPYRLTLADSNLEQESCCLLLHPV